MRTSRLLFALSLLLTAAQVHAQPDLVWSRTFGGNQADACNQIQQLPDGGFALIGSTQSRGAGYSDFWLVRVGALGDSLWSQTYGGKQYDEGHAFAQMADGGFILAGWSSSFGQGVQNYWLVGTDDHGEQQWTNDFYGPNIDYCYDALPMEDGGFILAGITVDYDAGFNNFYLVRTDSTNDDTLWTRSYGGEEDDYCYRIIRTRDGGFALIGGTKSFGAGNYDFWLLKTDVDGDSLWSHTYGGAGEDQCYGVVETSDGGFALAGWSASFGARDYDYYLMRTDSVGDSLWAKHYGGDDDEKCYTLLQTPDSGFVLGGTEHITGAGNNVLLMKTDKNGRRDWSFRCGGARNDWCNSLIQLSDGSYVFAGATESAGAGGSDMWLVHTSPDPASVGSERDPLPEASFLLPPYPNPFNQSSVVRYQLSAAGRVNLSLFDVRGRLVQTLINESQAAGGHQLIWNAAGCPAGTYLIQMRTNSQPYQHLERITLVK